MSTTRGGNVASGHGASGNGRGGKRGGGRGVACAVVGEEMGVGGSGVGGGSEYGGESGSGGGGVGVGVGPDGGRGRERGRGRVGGAQDESVIARRGRGGRRVRGRGRARVQSSPIDRSLLYVGDIFSSADSSTVPVGVPLEVPLHKKQPRRWNPNRSESPESSQFETKTELPLQEQRRQSAAGGQHTDAESANLLILGPATPAASCSGSQVPSLAEFMEIGRSASSTPTLSIPRAPLSTSTKSASRKRKFTYNDLHPELENLVNYGSDDELGGSDDEDNVYGFLQCPKSERIVMDILDKATRDDDPSESTDPASSASGAPAAWANQTVSASVEDASSYGPHLQEFDWKPLPKPPIPPLERREQFLLSSGPTVTLASPYDSFVAVWDSSIMKHNMDILDEATRDDDPSESTDPASGAPAAWANQTVSASVQEALSYGPHLQEFDWKPLPKPPIPPLERREQFLLSSGPTVTLASPYESFVAVWDSSIMEHIATETNRYAEQILEKALRRGDIGGYSRKLKFDNTNADEVYVFFALILATGIVVKADLTEYWSVNDDVFDTPNFGRYMTYTRFLGIAQMLHFVNNEDDISHLSPGDARVSKIASIVQHLNEKFQALYQLGQCISLDESLTQWKGWLAINQFIKNKAACRGIKTYEVCDSSSGYLWRFKVHAGRDKGGKDTGMGYITPLVLDLLKGLEYKGHTVFMDNYYNSPLLARLLKSRGFDCVGTLRLNSQNVPIELRTLKKESLDDANCYGVTSGDVDILVWKDRNLVSLISTYHGAASASRDDKSKPTLAHDYNVRMGGVDKKDQMLSAFPIERKRTAVWYKKFFRRLLNASVLNTYILHKESPIPHPHPHVRHRQYRKNLVNEILAKHGIERNVVVKPLKSALKVKFSTEMVRHFPTQFPFNEKLKQRKRGVCHICRKRTQFHCDGCDIVLCLAPCFVNHHT